MSDSTQPERARPRALSNAAVLRFAWVRWTRRPGRLAAIVAVTLLATVCDLSIPWAVKALTETVSDPVRRPDDAWAAWAGLTGLYVLFYSFRQGLFRLMNGFAARNMEDLTNEAFRRVQAFSADWHANTFAGSTVRQVSRAMWGLDSVSDTVFLMLGPAVLVLTGLSVSLAINDPVIGAVAALLIILYVAANVVLNTRYVRPANLRSNALDSKLGGALADAMSGNPTVKSFGAEERETARLGETTSAWRRASIETWTRFTDVGLLMNVLLVALQASLTGMMVYNWAQGRADTGDVLFAVTSFMLMSGYLRNVGEMVQGLQKGVDDLTDVAVFMQTPPQVGDRPDAPAFRPVRGEVVLDHVTFGYANAAEPLYRDFSLAIAPGERVALVGPTGAGKSTFVKLIQRLYDLDGGRILIDGQDISTVTQASLRRSIAVVPQDPALFHRSVAENISYGRPDATADQIKAAARRARAHDFITRLPQGYDTLVGERGVKLSGGERQRVALARAFLADARILVLDEATSSLDVETERQVQAAMDELMVGRTTIVIAHRLSTIRGADRILVFQSGRVVEEGRHGELLARGGAYARLHAVTEGAA
ncbi:MAG: ABC transporter ATP-binding protein/permease [Proteobacteria bacterium]|nr:ABC transporter ATP-binding protein/permease [Pseudomonadota bacterium]